MEFRPITCAVVSADEALRAQLSGALGLDVGLDVVLEVSEPVPSITAAAVEELLGLAPEMIVLDLEGAAAPALKLAQYLLDSDPSIRLVLTGADVGEDLLLAMLRLGAAEYLKKPVGPKDLSLAIDRVRRKLAPTAPDRGESASATVGRLHAFMAARPGQGCTTAAVNTAVQIRGLTGSRVLFVDLDLEFGDSDLHFGAAPSHDVVDLVRNIHRMDPDMLDSFTIEHPSGVRVLANPADPEKALTLSADPIGQALRLLRRHYDHVVLDAGHTGGLAAAAVVARADRTVLVSRPTLSSLRSARTAARRIEQWVGDSAGRIDLLLSAVGAGEDLSASDLEEAVGLPVLGRVPRDGRAVERAIEEGRPVSLGKSAVGDALTQMAASLAEVDRPQAGGLLGRVLGRGRGS